MTRGPATADSAAARNTALAPSLSSLAATRTPAEALIGIIAEAAVSQLTTLALPIRGVIIGPAGSGKTTSLHLVRDELHERGLRTTTSVPSTSTDEVLLIDDVQSHSDEDLEALLSCAADPAVNMVVTLRPGHDPRLQRLAERLEASCPPVLLGEVTAEQIVEATRIPLQCARAVLRLTGSLTWLTLAVVDAHDTGTCDADPTHRGMIRGLRGAIAHRLDFFDAPTRGAIEALCVFGTTELAARIPSSISWDDAIAAGCSAGVLEPNGAPPPAVRAAVRAVIPAHRLTALCVAHGLDGATLLDEDPGDPVWNDTAWTDRAHSPVGEASFARLIARADALRDDDPIRALTLYRAALAEGAEPHDLAIGYGIATLGTGDLEGAASCFDRLLQSTDPAAAADAIAAAVAIWAARGALTAGTAGGETSSAQTAIAFARTAVAALGAGITLPPPPTPSTGVHDTLTIASDALGTAVLDSLGDHVDDTVDALVLASELYSATHSDFPLVEPPAVVAAAAALSTGALLAAASALDSAVHAQQCGRWARPRLRLWQAWIAIQAARPAEARSYIDQARDCGATLLPRDRLILSACEVALARRYAHTAEVMTVFREASSHLLRRRFDIYLHPFLGELMLAAIRVGAASQIDRHFAAALETLKRTGEPPLWAPLLHWSGIQRGIVLGAPETLVPHARALLAASSHSPFAAQLAAAGRTWTDVLAGRVDVAAVEAAAQSLAHAGLAWDGARLAAHGAARTTDKHAYAQLLACARELHPKQMLDGDAPHPPPSIGMTDGGALSSREREVAVLVTQGKTYVEIGQALFISPRTAEHHIARIRRRLDATSRSDMLSKLRDLLGRDTSTAHDHEETP